MPDIAPHTVFHFIQRLACKSALDDLGDGRLLDSFIRQGSEPAFAALVHRHGALVWGVCRRVLANLQDAEDAFQATFLVLAQRARSIRRAESLASWLHGTAFRLAMKVRSSAARRRTREMQAARRPEPVPESSLRDVSAALDEELHHLPGKYQSALVQCYLQGKSRAQAARSLGWSLRTLDRRLARARELLRARLTRRGITLTAALLAVGMSQAAEPLPALLAASTAKMLMSFVLKKAAAAGLSAHAVKLAAGTAKGFLIGKKAALSFALVVGLMATGAGVIVHRVLATTPRAAEQRRTEALVSETPAPVREAGKKQARMDRYGDPLPPGVVNRIGSSRLRHAGMVPRLWYTPNGKALASASTDGYLQMWDTATGKLRWRLQTGADYNVALTGDAKRLALLGGSEYFLVAADTGTVLVRHTLPKVESGEGARCCAISPSGKQLAIGRFDRTVRLHDAVTGEETVRLTIGAKPFAIPLALLFGADSKTLYATVNQMPGVMVLDTTTGKLIRTLDFEGMMIHRLAMSPDFRCMAGIGGIGDRSDRIIFWNMESGKARQADILVPSPECAVFSPDGRLLGVGSQSKDIILFDTATGKEQSRLPWHPSTMSLAFSPDGKTLATGDNGGSVALWDVAKGCLRPTSPQPTCSLYELRFESGGKQLRTLGDGFSWWDAADGRLLRHLPRDPAWSIRFPSLSADEKLLAASLSRKPELVLIETATGHIVRTLNGHTKPGAATVFSPDGTKLISAGGFDPRVIVWNVANGKALYELTSHVGYVDLLAVSPDGHWLASAASQCVARCDFDIRLWDLTTGKLVHRLQSRQCSAMTFFPDSSRLVSAGYGSDRGDPGELRLWDVASGKVVRAFPGYKGNAVCVALTADGRMLATGGSDKTLRLWEVASGRERRAILGHEASVHSVDFSPDGRLLAAASDDAPVYIWNVYDPGQLESRAKHLPDQDRPARWQRLASSDCVDAFRAVCESIALGDNGVALMQHGWQSVSRATTDEMRQWLKDLDSDEFQKRKQATEKLTRFAADHEELLRNTRNKASALEVRNRLDEVLSRPSPERLRRTRMLEVLEQIGSERAKAFLAALAADKQDGPMAREATASLRRLEAKARDLSTPR